MKYAPQPNKPNKIDCASIHLAINFQHNDNNFVPLWDRKLTGAFLGRHKSYLFLGLGEVGNITTVSPNLHFCDDVAHTTRFLLLGLS